MPNQNTPEPPIGDLKSDEELAQEELKILEEAAKLADETEKTQEEFQEEVGRIQQEHPNLVFEPNPNLIGNGVEMSSEMMEWAYGIMNRVPRRKTKATKSTITKAERMKKRKAQKKARMKNRR